MKKRQNSVPEVINSTEINIDATSFIEGQKLSVDQDKIVALKQKIFGQSQQDSQDVSNHQSNGSKKHRMSEIKKAENLEQNTDAIESEEAQEINMDVDNSSKKVTNTETGNNLQNNTESKKTVEHDDGILLEKKEHSLLPQYDLQLEIRQDNDCHSASKETNEKPDNDLVKEIINRKLIEDDTATRLDYQDYEIALKENRFWIKKKQGLRSSLDRLAKYFSSVLQESNAIYEALPKDIQKELGSRKEGIQLCKRMLDRVCSRYEVKDDLEEIDNNSLLKFIQYEQINQKIKEANNDTIENEMNELLKSRKFLRKKIITDVYQCALSSEKIFQTVTERQVLPIIDGLDEGKKLAKVAFEKLVEQFPEQIDLLQNWFRIYVTLIGQFETELETLDMRSKTAKVGDLVDYEQFDPIDIEKDLAFENEQVKETIRRSYVLNYFGQKRVVRTGQVIIVKNS